MRRGGKWPLESARDGVVWVGMGWCRGLEGHRALTYDHQQKSSWTRSAELKGGAWPGWGEMSEHVLRCDGERSRAPAPGGSLSFWVLLILMAPSHLIFISQGFP